MNIAQLARFLMVDLAHQGESLTRHWCLHFPGFILEFNRRYSFTGRRHARQRGVCGDFDNFENLLAQSFKGARMFVGASVLCDSKRIKFIS